MHSRLPFCGLHHFPHCTFTSFAQAQCGFQARGVRRRASGVLKERLPAAAHCSTRAAMRAQAVDAVAGPMTGTVAASVREDGLVLVYGALVPPSASSLPHVVVAHLIRTHLQTFPPFLGMSEHVAGQSSPMRSVDFQACGSLHARRCAVPPHHTQLTRGRARALCACA